MPVKRDTKKNPFCTTSEKLFLKDQRFDNHWVRHSLMKTVESDSLQGRKDTKEGGDKKTTLICEFYKYIKEYSR